MNGRKIEILGSLFGKAIQTTGMVKLSVRLLGAMLFCAPAYTHAKVCEAELEQAVRAWEAWGSSTETITAARKRIEDESFGSSSLECAVALPASLVRARQQIEELAQKVQTWRSGPEVIFRQYSYFLARNQLSLCVLLEREAQCKSQKSSLTESDAQKIHTKLVESDRKIKADLEKHCENPLRFRCEWAVRDTQRLATEVNTYNSNPELVRLTGSLEIESPGIAAPYARRQQRATSAERLAAMASSGSSSSGTSSPSSTKTKFSIFDGLGVPSRSDCIQTEWVSESVPTSNNLTEAYFSSKGPRDPTGRDTTTDRKLLVATNVCKERLRFYAAGCGDVTMSSSGNSKQEGSWSAGELAQVGPYIIGPFLVLSPGSRIAVAESYVNKGSPGNQEMHPVQVAWGAWVNESVGTTNMNTTQAGEKLDRRAKAIHEELNRTVLNKPGLWALGGARGGSTPRRFRAYLPGANSCNAVNIQAVWDATQ